MIYFNGTKSRKIPAQYYLYIGTRSDGKTYDVLNYAFDHYLETGRTMAYVRRMDADFVGDNSAKTIYNSLMENGKKENVIFSKTNGEYNGARYFNGRYYLTKFDEKENRTVLCGDKCIAYAFAISKGEHYKSSSFPDIDIIFFDEFITRYRYLNDEFILFENLISTIARDRDDVTIFMCANTINQFYCPYFEEMGLTRIQKMKPGDIDVYKYGDSKLTVVVEMTGGKTKGHHKPSNVYFAFDNPRLKMIRGDDSQVWEMDIYPHLLMEYESKDIKLFYFIILNQTILQCEIIIKGKEMFTFIHRKTTPIKDIDHDIVFTHETSGKPRHYFYLTKPVDQITKLIYSFFVKKKVFYQSNEIGEMVNTFFALESK